VAQQRVVIIGAGGQAKIIADALLLSDDAEPVGFLDDHQRGVGFMGLPILGAVDELPDLVDAHGIDAGIVSIGDNYRRGQIVDAIEAAISGFPWANAIHPMTAIGAGCEVGHGVHMMAGAVVNPASTVGDHVHIDTRASLDHDSSIGRCASLGPTSATGGGCTIGAYVAVSIGAVVLHGRSVGDHSVIGAGATVTADIPAGVVAFGTPARVVRDRPEGERYL
jgi:sugar O-acyltransferase (sialic acid O-acetyltransferase NeuD family)